MNDVPRVIKQFRGSAADHVNYVGPRGHVSVDTSSWTLRVHDGVTPGGHPLAHLDSVPGVGNAVLGFGINRIERLTQAEYDALPVKHSTTLYVITPPIIPLGVISYFVNLLDVPFFPGSGE